MPLSRHTAGNERVRARRARCGKGLGRVATLHPSNCDGGFVNGTPRLRGARPLPDGLIPSHPPLFKGRGRDDPVCGKSPGFWARPRRFAPPLEKGRTGGDHTASACSTARSHPDTPSAVSVRVELTTCLILETLARVGPTLKHCCRSGRGAAWNGAPQTRNLVRGDRHNEVPVLRSSTCVLHRARDDKGGCGDVMSFLQGLQDEERGVRRDPRAPSGLA
jgi:hypothetical protein